MGTLGAAARLGGLGGAKKIAQQAIKAVADEPKIAQQWLFNLERIDKSAHRIMSKSIKTLGKGAVTAGRGATAAGRQLKKPAVKRIPLLAGIKLIEKTKRDETEESAALRLVDDIRRIASSDMMLKGTHDALLHYAAGSPKVVGSTIETSMRATDYMAQNLPKVIEANPTTGTPRRILRSQLRPFASKMMAINSPIQVLQRLVDPDVPFDANAWDAIQVVYPQLANAWMMKIAERQANAQLDARIRRRLRLLGTYDDGTEKIAVRWQASPDEGRAALLPALPTDINHGS